jgi:hypothetical protein
MKFPFSFSNQVWVHLAGVILFMSMPVLFSPDLFNAFSLFQVPPFQREFLTYFLLVLFFYANYLFFIPKLYFQRKYILFFVCVLAFVVLIVFIPRSIFPPQPHPHPLNLPPPPHGGPGHPPKKFPLLFLFGHTFIFSVAILFLAFTLKMSNLWKQSQREKLDAELLYLKAQINPHFLFNTLNSIYSLAIVKSDLTASAIVKLSGMMRYVLSEAHMDKVSLEKETTYIADYIELQKLRLSESVKLHFLLTGYNTGKQIAPLLLIPFIENAFKFGVNPEKKSEISIHIDVKESSLFLFVKNDTVNDSAERNGLGLANTRNRLALMYPGKHELTITDETTTFTVSLKIYFV